MANVKRAINRTRQSGKKGHKQSGTRGEVWVRKSVVMDQRKLDAARRVLGVATETEAIDAALDLVVFPRQLVREIAAIRRAGGI